MPLGAEQHARGPSRPRRSCSRRRSRSLAPCSSRASIRTTGCPQRPNPPTASDGAVRDVGDRLRGRRHDLVHVSSPRRLDPTDPPAAARRCRQLGQHPLRHGQGAVGGGHPGVHGGVHQHLADLLARHPVRHGAAHVQRELVVVTEPGQQRHGQQAAGAPVQARARPDVAPGVPGDQVLERCRERGARGDGAVDVRVTEHLAAHSAPCAARASSSTGRSCQTGRTPVCARSRSATASGCSSTAMCAAGSSTTSRAPGMPAAIASRCSGGVDGS